MPADARGSVYRLQHEPERLHCRGSWFLCQNLPGDCIPVSYPSQQRQNLAQRRDTILPENDGPALSRPAPSSACHPARGNPNLSLCNGGKCRGVCEHRHLYRVLLAEWCRAHRDLPGECFPGDVRADGDHYFVSPLHRVYRY